MKTSTLLLTWLALMALLALSVGLALAPLPVQLKPALGLVIAAVKAFLIATIFMHLRKQSGLTRLFAVAGVFWLLLLFLLAGADYLTRGWM